MSFKSEIPFNNEATISGMAINFNKLTKISQDLSKNFKDLLEYIRNEYLEIDLDETSKNALEEYEKYHSTE